MLDNFAEELKNTRLSKNLTLQQVSVKTRIDLKFLEAMERGDFEFLPELYVNSFLKEYLRILELDEQIYMKKYKAAKTGVDLAETQVPDEPEEKKSVTPQAEKPPVPPKASQFDAVRNYKRKEEESSASRKKKQYTYYITGAVIIGAGILYLLFFNLNDEIIVPEKSWDEIVEDTRERYNGGEDTNTMEAENLPAASVTDSLSLTIRATDTTWVKIVLDNSRTEEFILFPGSQKSMKTRENYKLVIGNSGGVNLDLNGKPLNFKLQSGAVQRIQIDSSGVKGLEQEISG